MSHEIAKLLLEKAETFLKRADAVKAALALGMPLREIEAYLDWLDLCHAESQRRKAAAPQNLTPKTLRVPAAIPAALPAPPVVPQQTVASRTGS